MIKTIIITLLLILTSFQAITQTDKTEQIKRCNQYQSICNYLVDTSNLKFFSSFGVNISEINLKIGYRHFAMREMIERSFKNYLNDSSLYKTISIQNKSSVDSITFTNEFLNNDCIAKNFPLLTKPNFYVIFDRYNEQIVFANTRYTRTRYSFGETHIFWFGKNQEINCKTLGYVE
jgi:hypothetical protein